MALITSSTVFAVSGGARGITADCVKRLAEHYRCRFILLGRSALKPQEPDWARGAHDEPGLKTAAMNDLKARGEKPTPAAVAGMVSGVQSQREIAGTLDAVRSAGGQAEYVSVDITDAAALKSALGAAASRLGPITGLIHGAGVLADKLIENKTQKDFEAVYGTKIHGLENLLSAVPAGQLQTLVLFSSVAGFYGNTGQADYALANEILNKAAHLYKHRHPECRVISINWGPWAAGMVTPQLKAYFEANAIKVIPVEVGAHILIEELEALHGEDTQIVVGGGGIARPVIEPSGDLKVHRLHRRLSLHANPFLQDHVVDGKAVLPMVCGMSWMSNAAEGLYPGFRAFGFENYRVLKGIVFDETLAAQHTLELKEVSKDAEQITLDAMISSLTADGKPRFHYSTRLFALAKNPPMPRFDAIDLAVREDIPGSQFYDDYTLFHHFSFKGVERVLNISRELVTMQCRLPVVESRYQGQFPVQSFNYFMTDIGFQAMGIYAKYFYGAGSLPLRAGGGEHYADVPWGGEFYVSLEILSASETGLVTTLNIHDLDGNLYMRVLNGEITISKNLNDLFRRNRLPQPISY
jgi:NAD(P)-dependent dehydrogenase (short-subunit alcohol dehydrogenase family)